MSKQAKKDKDEPHSDEEQLDEVESEDEEVWDPDYQEHHEADDLTKKPEKPADPNDSDDDIEDFDVMELDEEAAGDEVEPPSTELVKTRKVVANADRTTSERISMYECARILGDRARHIDNKAKPYIDTKNCTSSLEIAYLELMQKRIPMAVIRKVGLGHVEVWRLSEMTIPKLPPIQYFMC